MKPLAIVGIGCLFPKAEGLDEYWSNIKERIDAIGDVPPSHWRPEDYFDADPKRPDRTYGRRGGFLPPVDFDPTEFGLAPSNIPATDPAQVLGLVVAQRALRDAGYGPEKAWDKRRASVILGVTGTLELAIPLGARLGHPIWRRALNEAGVTGERAEAVVRRISDSYVEWQENSFPGLLGNVVAGRIANRLDLGGTNCVVDAACASSLSATHMASMELAAGRADLVITGGVDCFNDIFMYMCFSKTPALSPTGNSRPFDAAGDGTILGEGVGMVVLKRLEDAVRDGDKVYAVLKAVGSSSDGRGKAIYAPSPEGQVKALKSAYELAAVSPDTIELVEAHGTGTKVGDAAEVKALAEVYRAARPEGTWVALGSVKSSIGHTKAAAGAAGLIKAAMALKNKVLPPTIKVETPLPALASGETPFYVSAEKRPWLPPAGHPRRAAVSAFGFGGSNFHAVLEEHEGTKSAPDWDGTVELVALSAPTREALAAELSAWTRELPWTEARAKAWSLRRSFDSAKPFRLAAVIQKGAAAAPMFAAALKAVESGKDAFSLPDGLWFAAGPTAGPVAFLFPGQGAQYVGMGRDLACHFPEVLDAWTEADGAWTKAGKAGRISDLAYPQSAFDDRARSGQESALRDTRAAQPALGALGLGFARVLARFGLAPAMAAGHSYGELPALWAAGRLSSEELYRLSILRGALMAGDGKDRGSMAAVSASPEELAKVLAEQGLDLVLANKNAPRQTVISGATAEIERAVAVLAARGFKAVRLPVSAAFHSPLVSEAREPFAQALASVGFGAAKLPVFANSSAAEYPPAPEKARALLAGQLASPVEFVAQVRAMHEAGARVFVEVGAGARLSGLVGAILEGRPHAAVAVDSSGGKRRGLVDLARALAQLASLGARLDLSAWERPEAPAAAKKPALTVPVSGATPVNPKRDVPAPRFDPIPDHATDTMNPKQPPVSAAPANASPSLQEALRVSAEGIAALQRLQEQAAVLHQQYLAGQEATQRTLLAMIEQQTRLLAGLPAGAPVPQPAPISLPAMPAPAVVPAMPTPVQAPKPAAAVAASAPVAGIEPLLLSIVAEKTGYPAETLSLDMGLESDLGIDSIKRVEILSALREKRPDLPAVGPQHLGTLRTLRQIIEFLSKDAPAPQAAPAAVGIEPILLAVVAEKTGYPAETLNLDMGLESDLGIDSIKRVEILSALREKRPDLPAVGPQHLGTLRTLRQIIDFLGKDSPAPQPAVAASPAPGIEPILLAVVAEKTGYPAETLNLDMGLESDLGIDSIKRVEILSALREKRPDLPAVGPQQLGALRTLRQIIEFLSQGAPAAAPALPVPAPLPAAQHEAAVQRSILEAVPFDGAGRAQVALPPGSEVWIADDGALAKPLAAALKRRGLAPKLVSAKSAAKLEVPEKLGGLVLLAPVSKARAGLWTEASEAAIKDAFQLLKAAGPALRRSAGALMTVSRLDGAFGLRAGRADMDPLSGALAGLAKSAAREWPEVSCKALDLEPADAETLAEEFLIAGPEEIGVSGSGKIVLRLVDAPLADAAPALGESDVVLVTGGARGATAAAALELAKARRPIVVLLGRSPEPQDEPEWLRSLDGETAIKAAIARIANGSKPSPKTIEETYRRHAANREILRALAALRAAGSRAEYVSCDARDEKAVRAAVAKARALGPVRGLVHGAGVLADRRIEDKTAAHFDSVFDTKVAGLRLLLGALAQDELAFIALYSSTSGRLGRVGQADYAAANEALSKAAHVLAAARPKTRVAAIGWGALDGGMVTAALKKVFAAEGVGVLPLDVAGRHLVREIALPPGAAVETVAVAPDALNRLSANADLPLAFERTIDAESHPVLDSHRLAGHPVLPLALSAEWLACGALHANPGLRFFGFDGLRVLKGVSLNGEPVKVRVSAGKARKDGDIFRVPVELRAEGRNAPNVRGEALLADRLPQAPAPAAAPSLAPYSKTVEAAYSEVLFHGPALRLIEAVEGVSPDGLSARLRPAPRPADWMSAPIREGWVTDPGALDAAFQAAILWSCEVLGAPCLPAGLASFKQFASFPAEGFRAILRTARRGESVAVLDIDFVDLAGKLIARVEASEHTVDAGLTRSFKDTVPAG